MYLIIILWLYNFDWPIYWFIFDSTNTLAAGILALNVCNLFTIVIVPTTQQYSTMCFISATASRKRIATDEASLEEGDVTLDKNESINIESCQLQKIQSMLFACYYLTAFAISFIDCR